MQLGTAQPPPGDAHLPVHAAVAHDDMAGAQPAAQLRGHRQQAHAWGAARCVCTGGGSLGPDKRGYQPVKFIQGIERPQELRSEGTSVKFNMFSGKESFYLFIIYLFWIYWGDIG